MTLFIVNSNEFHISGNQGPSLPWLDFFLKLDYFLMKTTMIMLCYAVLPSKWMFPQMCPLIHVLKGRIRFIVFDGILLSSTPFEDDFFIKIFYPSLVLIVTSENLILICSLVMHHDGCCENNILFSVNKGGRSWISDIPFQVYVIRIDIFSLSNLEFVRNDQIGALF